MMTDALPQSAIGPSSVAALRRVDNPQSAMPRGQAKARTTNRRGRLPGPSAHQLLAELKRHTTRSTHQLAKAIGKSVYLTTTYCHGMMRSGHIRRVSKGKPGKGGWPAVWGL
jgi:hypothetical protein